MTKTNKQKAQELEKQNKSLEQVIADHIAQSTAGAQHQAMAGRQLVGHSHVPSWLHGASISPFGGIAFPPEEKKELDDLERDHKREIKTELKNKFKSYPSHVREAVITQIGVEKCVADLKREPFVSKSDRLKYLEAKHAQLTGGYYGSPGVYLGHSGAVGLGLAYDGPYSEMKLTYEELKEAHADACTEEMLKGE